MIFKITVTFYMMMNWWCDDDDDDDDDDGGCSCPTCEDQKSRG